MVRFFFFMNCSSLSVFFFLIELLVFLFYDSSLFMVLVRLSRKQSIDVNGLLNECNPKITRVRGK